METWLKDFARKFGAFLVGTVMLVVVWRVIAQPILAQQAEDRAEDRKALVVAKEELVNATKALTIIVSAMERIQDKQDTSARIQERVVDKLLQLDRR